MRGQKTGGRKAGTPNKRTQDIADRLGAMGCDPIEGMALLAMDEKNSPELRGRMFSELAQYVAPKRKAVALEHSGPDGGPIQSENHVIPVELLTGDERAALRGMLLRARETAGVG